MTVYVFESEQKNAEYMKQMLIRLVPESSEVQINPPFQAALISLQNEEMPVCFVDTRLKVPGGNFLLLARKLREENEKCHICFMAPSPEDMAFCFKKLVRPSAFLLKPGDEEEVKNLLGEIQSFEFSERPSAVEPQMVVKNRGVHKIIRINEVLYFTSVEKKIFCHTTSEEEVSFYGSLGQIETEYGEYLLRCHSGFLVNKRKIESFSRSTMSLTVRGVSTQVPVSKSRCRAVEEFIRKS